jgi:hypothetical protein
MGFKEVFCLFPELLKIRARWKRLRHVTFLLSPVVRLAGSIKVMLFTNTCRWAQPFPRTRMRPERTKSQPYVQDTVKAREPSIWKNLRKVGRIRKQPLARNIASPALFHTLAQLEMDLCSTCEP